MFFNHLLRGSGRPNGIEMSNDPVPPPSPPIPPLDSKEDGRIGKSVIDKSIDGFDYSPLSYCQFLMRVGDLRRDRNTFQRRPPSLSPFINKQINTSRVDPDYGSVAAVIRHRAGKINWHSQGGFVHVVIGDVREWASWPKTRSAGCLKLQSATFLLRSSVPNMWIMFFYGQVYRYARPKSEKQWQRLWVDGIDQRFGRQGWSCCCLDDMTLCLTLESWTELYVTAFGGFLLWPLWI